MLRLSPFLAHLATTSSKDFRDHCIARQSVNVAAAKLVHDSGGFFKKGMATQFAEKQLSMSTLKKQFTNTTSDGFVSSLVDSKVCGKPFAQGLAKVLAKSLNKEIPDFGQPKVKPKKPKETREQIRWRSILKFVLSSSRFNSFCVTKQLIRNRITQEDRCAGCELCEKCGEGSCNPNIQETLCLSPPS